MVGSPIMSLPFPNGSWAVIRVDLLPVALFEDFQEIEGAAGH